MRVFVITLPGATDRRAAAARQLRAAGVPYQFFEAVRGEDVCARGRSDSCDEVEFLLNTGRYVTKEEKGCFASHRALWKRAVSLGEPILILEDDFELRENFPAALRCATRIINSVGYLRLQNDLRARKRQLAVCDRFVVSRYTKPPHGTMCYCISPTVAQHFVECTRTMDAPVDVFVKRFWIHGKPLHALTPYAVYPSELSKRSTIGRPPKRKKPIEVSLRRAQRKTGWYLRRGLFNLSLLLRPSYVFIEQPAAPGDRALDADLSRQVPVS